MLREVFSKFVHHWRVLFRNSAYRSSLIIGILVFLAGFFVNYSVSIYKDIVHFPSVGDIILNQLPTLNLEFIYEQGMYIVVALIFAYPVLFRPELAPFMLKTYGILMLVRAGFVLLTQIGPPEGFFYADLMMENASPLGKFFFRNDLFFSGHTAVPFLAFLLMKGERFRWVMLIASFVMAATVLLMHLHYSIDVFAAFFIAHGIYTLSDRIFNTHNKLFLRIIQLHGWQAFQKRMAKLEAKRKNAWRRLMKK